MKKKRAIKKVLKKVLTTLQDNVIGGDPRETIREREKRKLQVVRRAAYYGP